MQRNILQTTLLHCTYTHMRAKPTQRVMIGIACVYSYFLVILADECVHVRSAAGLAMRHFIPEKKTFVLIELSFQGKTTTYEGGGGRLLRCQWKKYAEFPKRRRKTIAIIIVCYA